MNIKFDYFIIFVSVSILSFVSIPGQCESSDKEINIYSTFGTPTKLPKSLESPNGKYVAILTTVEGGAKRLTVKISPKEILDSGIIDINSIQWLPDGDSLIFTVSPIHGKPGIYTWNITDNVIKKILKPKTFNKVYPDGKDYFEILSLSEDGNKLFFFYSPDIDKTDFGTFRLEENLYVINVDGTGLRKIIDEGKILNDFLYSKEIREEEQAYWYILRNKGRFSEKVFQELIKYQDRTDAPDKLIYLATILREERFIEPLVSLIVNPEYSESRCIYSCPIVFSLTIYACFSEYSLPQDLFEKKLMAVGDLKSDIKSVKTISLIKEKASDYRYKGPVVDSFDPLYQAYEPLTAEQLIELAGPYNEDFWSRWVAARILSYYIDNDEHILRLYWLVIKDAYGAAGEYRAAIYNAIYKAETARSRKQKKEKN